MNKVKHTVETFASNSLAIVHSVDKKAEEENEVREYITTIYDRRNVNRSSEAEKKRFRIENLYNEEGYGIDENIDCVDHYDTIEEAIKAIKEANEDALISFRED